MQIELDQPFAVDAQGRIAFTNDPSRILMNRVRMVVGTFLGERVMRPGYGTPLGDLLFDADDELTASLVTSAIQSALAQWEPGALVESVVADTSDTRDGIVNINVTYSAVNSPLQTLTVPVNTATLHRGGAVQEERNG